MRCAARSRWRRRRRAPGGAALLRRPPASHQRRSQQGARPERAGAAGLHRGGRRVPRSGGAPTELAGSVSRVSRARSSTGWKTSTAAPTRSRRRRSAVITPSERETTQLADGYRARGETLRAHGADAARHAAGARLPDPRGRGLSRGADAVLAASPGFGNAAASIRDTQKRLERVELRLAEMSKSEGGGSPWD